MTKLIEGIEQFTGKEHLELAGKGLEADKESIRRCIQSFPYWLANHCYTRDPRQKGKKRTIFWDPVNYEYMYHIAEQMPLHRRQAYPKSRQMGMSWLVMAFALWNTQFTRPFNTYVISQKKADSQKLIDRAKFMYLNQSLNHELLKHVAYARMDKGTMGTASAIQFYPPWQEYKYGFPKKAIPPNRVIVSKMEALSRDPDDVRGKTASLVIYDEAAHNEDAEEGYGAIDPSLGDGGTIIFLSSANGKNFFYRTCFDIVDEEAV